MTELKNRTISSLFWKMLERGGYALALLAIQVVMARLLTPEDFGMLAIIIVFVNIGSVVSQSGLNTALIQSPDASEDDLSTVFWLSISLSAILYILIFFFAPMIASFYSNDALVDPLRVLALVLPLGAFNSIQIAIVTRNMDMRKTFISTLGSTILSGALGIFAALSGAGIWALVVQQLSYIAINCIILGFALRWLPSFRFSLTRAKVLFGFGWKLLVSGLLNTAYQGLYSLIIGKQFSEQELGLVNQGERFPMAIANILDGAIQPVMLSAISKVQDRAEDVKQITRRAIKTSSFLVMPVMGLFALIAEPFTVIFLGERWLPAVPFIQMFCFAYALNPIQTSNLQALNGTGRSDIFLKLELIKKSYGVCIILFASIVLQNVYAIVIGFMLSSVISTFVNAYPNKRVIGYGYGEQVKDLAPIFGVVLISMTITWSVNLTGLSNWSLLLTQTLVMLVSYIGLAKLFRLEAFGYLIATAKEFISR